MSGNPREAENRFNAIRKDLVVALKKMSFIRPCSPDDEKTIELTLLAMECSIVNIPRLEGVPEELISFLTPDHKYAKFIETRDPDEFWRDQMVSRLFDRVELRHLTIVVFSLCLGVTPEMVHCNMGKIPPNFLSPRTKPSQQQQSSRPKRLPESVDRYKMDVCLEVILNFKS